MNLYVESSAALAWLLGESRAEEIREILASSDLVVASDLTLVECDRVLIRAAHLAEMPEADAAARRADLGAASGYWTLLHVAGDIIDRARQRYPAEPVRTLDALHLASALTARAAVGDIEVLSLDETIRANARLLGLPLQPPDADEPSPPPL